ncbi:MAG: pilX [Rhodocyclaceae bacterium]|nr:pilX [Rhodocyclaceae bacterium]
MLAKTGRFSRQAESRARQRGTVLLIALIVLVAMTLGSIALVRSTDTANLIAGNLAFQQSATLAGDTGIGDAVKWLDDCANNRNGRTVALLDSDSALDGYAAAGSAAANNPAAGESWDAYWLRVIKGTRDRQTSGSPDAAGNRTFYVIDRLCNFAGSPSGGASCTASPVVTTATGNEEEAGSIQLKAASVVYYRITARIEGPRNTVSYVQTMVSM